MSTEIITLPTISLSAPATRAASRINSPKSPKGRFRSAVSASTPNSPKAIAKHGWRVIKNSGILSKPIVTSPGRALRKKTYAVTFGKMARTESSSTLCPVHSYANPISSLKRHGTAKFSTDTTARGLLATDGPAVHSYADPISSLKHKGATKFSLDTTARGAIATDGPNIHSYSEPTSTLKRTGTAKFSTDKTTRGAIATDGPNVHSYADPISSLKRTGTAKFSTDKTTRGAIATDGPAVHSYADPFSTLKRTGATAFSKGTFERSALDGRTAVHSYADPLSTLKTSGVAPFGQPRAPRGFERALQLAKPPAPKCSMQVKLNPIRAPSPVSVEDELSHD